MSVGSRSKDLIIRSGHNIDPLMTPVTDIKTYRMPQPDHVFALVALDATTMSIAARITERTLCRSLDAVHLGAARRAGQATALLTFDVRQARAAREIGMTVIGA